MEMGIAAGLVCVGCYLIYQRWLAPVVTDGGAWFVIAFLLFGFVALLPDMLAGSHTITWSTQWPH